MATMTGIYAVRGPQLADHADSGAFSAPRKVQQPRQLAGRMSARDRLFKRPNLAHRFVGSDEL
jgi:hypothetical protein